MPERNLIPDIQGLSIVVIGDFNPAIMQPRWFSDNELIRAKEAEKADVEIVHKKVTSFKTESFGLQVTEDQFTVRTQDPTMFLPLRDLTFGTFSILEHTPIRAFGINRDQHVQLGSEEEWHAFGHFFAPKAAWQEILQEPGLKALSIEGRRAGAPDAVISFRIQPSKRVSHGIFIHMNEHYQIDENLNGPDAMALFLEKLRTAWEGIEEYWQSAGTVLLNAHRKEGT